MGDKSNIEWTDATWNPVRGCALVSAGGEWYPWCEPEQLCGDRNKLPRGLVYFPGPHYIFEHRGKKAAGNLLDGRTHLEYPACRG